MAILLSNITARPYAGVQDLAAIAALINTCIVCDRLDGLSTVAALEHEYSSPDFDLVQDLRLWFDQSNTLGAVAECWLPKAPNEQRAYLTFWVKPTVRGQGIETEILAWAEQRLRTVACDRQLPAVLQIMVRETQTDRLDLLKQQGFTLSRSFYRMGRSLAEPIPHPQLPVGYTVRPLQPTELEAWVELFNQSFVDHWNFLPLTVRDRQHWNAEPDYQPELDLVAIAPDGTFAAFCYCFVETTTNTQRGVKEGWIADLGTRRGFRRQGLGRAMLLTGLQALQAQSLNTALLGVDTQNPSGAMGLYESVGFQPYYTSLVWTKKLL